MLAVHDLEIRVGARVLMSGVSFRVADGDKIGLVGRNGAGKTTLTKVLAGDLLPSDGKVTKSGELGYLPQDPRSGDPEMLARTRILDARGLGTLQLGIATASHEMASDDPKVADKAMRRFANLTERFEAMGGYAAEAEAASIAHNLSLPDRILDQPLKTLSGGQRRRIELARILFSDAGTMILDEPTNHLDADSVVWLREFLKGYKGGLIVISHDVELVGETVNRVFYLDAMRQVIDIYNMGWKHYQRQRVADEERRKKERANAEKKATALQLQAAKFGAKASKAAAAHQMMARAEKMLSGLEEV
ncbi:MAG: ATP-binding cassette domain-containing protein, partial [Microbacterium sp.]|nr:ATP-binding cassette domain-containing protein [Microbacterium sp.]